MLIFESVEKADYRAHTVSDKEYLLIGIFLTNAVEKGLKIGHKIGEITDFIDIAV